MATTRHANAIAHAEAASYVHSEMASLIEGRVTVHVTIKLTTYRVILYSDGYMQQQLNQGHCTGDYTAATMGQAMDDKLLTDCNVRG